MVVPGTYNPTVQRRADFLMPLALSDSNGAAIDLTGWTAYAQVWDEGRSTKFADFSVSYDDRPNGQITISLSDTDTATLPNEAWYDLLLEDASGLREYYLQGILYVSEGYTAP